MKTTKQNEWKSVDRNMQNNPEFECRVQLNRQIDGRRKEDAVCEQLVCFLIRESTEKCATVIDDDEDNVVSFSDDGCTTVCSLFTVHDSMQLLQFYFFISIFAIMLFIISQIECVCVQYVQRTFFCSVPSIARYALANTKIKWQQ